MSGRSWSPTECRTTRCTTRAILRLAAGPAPGQWPPARRSAPADGLVRRRRSVVCTHSTAVSSEVAGAIGLGRGMRPDEGLGEGGICLSGGVGPGPERSRGPAVADPGYLRNIRDPRPLLGPDSPPP